MKTTPNYCGSPNQYSVMCHLLEKSPVIKPESCIRPSVFRMKDESQQVDILSRIAEELPTLKLDTPDTMALFEAIEAIADNFESEANCASVLEPLNAHRYTTDAPEDWVPFNDAYPEPIYRLKALEALL